MGNLEQTWETSTKWIRKMELLVFSERDWNVWCLADETERLKATVEIKTESLTFGGQFEGKNIVCKLETSRYGLQFASEGWNNLPYEARQTIAWSDGGD
ncbi:MAG: hypothetical protein ACTS4U_00540 [Candidatus Hodgkinia cicadicola]